MAQICQIIGATNGVNEKLNSFILDFNDKSIDEDEEFVFQHRKLALMKAQSLIAQNKK